MDVLIQFQGARKNKAVFCCVENVPVTTLSRLLTEADFAQDLLKALPLFEDRLNDSFYISGFIDKAFCNRKVSLTVSYDDFCRQACGLGETSSID